jgi:putative transposase
VSKRKTNPDTDVPWTGFDLINAFNTWKKVEDAGRLFAVETNGEAAIVVTGLAWRAEVCQQVFEEAAVDCGRALAAWSDCRVGGRNGKRIGFPRSKKKTATVGSRQNLNVVCRVISPAASHRAPTGSVQP